jgi:hypothetical protein
LDVPRTRDLANILRKNYGNKKRLSLFQNSVSFGTGFRRKLPILYMLSIYGFRNFLRGKKLFQKLKFWNSLNYHNEQFLRGAAFRNSQRIPGGQVICFNRRGNAALYPQAAREDQGKKCIFTMLDILELLDILFP